MHEQLKMAIRRELQEENLPFTEQEPLAEHTTFRIGGPATFWLTPSDVEQLRRSLLAAKEMASAFICWAMGQIHCFRTKDSMVPWWICAACPVRRKFENMSSWQGPVLRWDTYARWRSSIA